MTVDRPVASALVNAGGALLLAPTVADSAPGSGTGTGFTLSATAAGGTEMIDIGSGGILPASTPAMMDGYVFDTQHRYY